MGSYQFAVDTLPSVALFISIAGRGEPCGAAAGASYLRNLLSPLLSDSYQVWMHIYTYIFEFLWIYRKIPQKTRGKNEQKTGKKRLKSLKMRVFFCRRNFRKGSVRNFGQNGEIKYKICGILYFLFLFYICFWSYKNFFRGKARSSASGRHVFCGRGDRKIKGAG